jgi:hypothetical protein
MLGVATSIRTVSGTSRKTRRAAPRNRATRQSHKELGAGWGLAPSEIGERTSEGVSKMLFALNEEPASPQVRAPSESSGDYPALAVLDAGRRIVSDGVQWIVQARAGDHWRSTHFCRTRAGLARCAGPAAAALLASWPDVFPSAGFELKAPRSQLAHHRMQLVACPMCGRQVERRSRQQVFCSGACREKARVRSRKGATSKNGHTAKLVGLLGRDTGVPTNPHKKSNEINVFQAAKPWSSTGIRAPAGVIAAEIASGRTWLPITSKDGVAGFIAQLAPALIARDQR